MYILTLVHFQRRLLCVILETKVIRLQETGTGAPVKCGKIAGGEEILKKAGRYIKLEPSVLGKKITGGEEILK